MYGEWDGFLMDGRVVGVRRGVELLTCIVSLGIRILL
jgi:hypothetical protein